MQPFPALADWQSFFSAQVGAAATLAGLLFVGVSLNLSKILAGDFLPLRAFLALCLLVAVLVLASLLLIPGQTRIAAGLEALGVGVAVWALGTVVEIRGWRRRSPSQHRSTFVFNALLLECAALALAIGGGLVLAGSPSGLDWIGAGMVLCYAKAVADSWVLLVEINR